jgi:hypothetical protein
MVILKNGTVLSGRVWRETGWVAIESETGILRLPARRVIAITTDAAGPRQEKQQVAAAPQPEPAPGPEAQPSAPAPAATGAAGRRPSAREVLNSRMTVDFEGVPVYELLSFVQLSTDVNMAVATQVREDTRPVTVHLREVPVSTILEIALDSLGFGYEVYAGDVIYVRDKAATRAPMRIYDVRDLLVDWGDADIGDDDDDDDDDDSSDARDDDDDDDDGARSQVARARELVDLIKLATGRSRWRQETQVAEPAW